MNGILISLLNVLVVAMAIGLAIRFGGGEKARRNALLLLLSGVGAYIYTGWSLLAEHRCQPKKTLFELLIEMSGCIGQGDKLLALAQAAIIAGVLILVALPIKRAIMKHASGDISAR